MVTILSLSIGVMGFEQSTIFFLSPFIQPDLKLSNTQIGMLVSGYWICIAISSYAMSVLADFIGPPKWKILLLLLNLGMSCFSVFSGWASSFALLLAARSLMG